MAGVDLRRCICDCDFACNLLCLWCDSHNDTRNFATRVSSTQGKAWHEEVVRYDWMNLVTDVYILCKTVYLIIPLTAFMRYPLRHAAIICIHFPTFGDC